MPVNRQKETKNYIHRMMVKGGITIPQSGVDAIAAEDAAFDELDRREAEQNARPDSESEA